MGNRELEVNDQEETILSTHARAALLSEAVREAKSQIDAANARRGRMWMIGGVALVMALLTGILAAR